MSRSNLAYASFIAATLALGTVMLIAIDAGSRFITENDAARAFILSDAFWPAVIGFIVVMAVALYLVVSSPSFHPGRPSGRTAAERGE